MNTRIAGWFLGAMYAPVRVRSLLTVALAVGAVNAFRQPNGLYEFVLVAVLIATWRERAEHN